MGNLMQSFARAKGKQEGISEHQVKTRLRQLAKRLGFNPFADMLTCPICTQVKDPDEYVIREVIHLASHLRNTAWYAIEFGEWPDGFNNQEYQKLPPVNRKSAVPRRFRSQGARNGIPIPRHPREGGGFATEVARQTRIKYLRLLIPDLEAELAELEAGEPMSW